jgi:hypothetical protein
MEKIVIKRDWNDAQIKVGMDAGGIYIETSISEFEKRLASVIEENLPRSLSYSLRLSSIRSIVTQVFEAAFHQVCMEMKKETIKIV